MRDLASSTVLVDREGCRIRHLVLEGRKEERGERSGRVERKRRTQESFLLFQFLRVGGLHLFPFHHSSARARKKREIRRLTHPGRDVGIVVSCRVASDVLCCRASSRIAADVFEFRILVEERNGKISFEFRDDASNWKSDRSSNLVDPDVCKLHVNGVEIIEKRRDGSKVEGKGEAANGNRVRSIS